MPLLIIYKIRYNRIDRILEMTVTMTDHNDDENPWGKKKKDPHIKDEKQVDDFVEQIREKINKNRSNIETPWDKKTQNRKGPSGGGNGEFPTISKGNFLVIGLAAMGLWLASGVYMLQEGDVSVVLRFGKQDRISGAAGLNYRLPWPVEMNIIRHTDEIKQIDSGNKEDNKDDQTLVLTGDEKIIHANYSVRWKIKDLPNYLFTNRDPETTIKAAAESAIREVLGQTTARLALSSERDKIGSQAGEVLQKIIDHYELGVEIRSFQLQMVKPPTEVVEAFNDMQASSIDASKMENDAHAYANSLIPNARGQAVSLVQDAKAYAETALGKAKGEAAQFESIHNAVKDNKKITLKRLYLEGMQKILSQVKNKTIIDGSIGNGVLPYVSLDRKSDK